MTVQHPHNVHTTDEVTEKISSDQYSEHSTYLKGWRLGIIIISLYMGAFLIALDTNIVGVAIPQISTEFQALQDISWYGSAYLLTITAFQPMLGNFYKFFAAETTYKGCIVIFESKTPLVQFSVACAWLVTNLSWNHNLRSSCKFRDVHRWPSHSWSRRGRNLARSSEYHRLRRRAQR